MSESNHGPADGPPNQQQDGSPQGPRGRSVSARALAYFRQRQVAGLLALSARRRLVPPGDADLAFVQQTMRRLTASPQTPNLRFTLSGKQSASASRLWAAALASVAMALVLRLALAPSQAPAARLTAASGAVTWKPALDTVGTLLQPGQPLREGFLETLTPDSSARVRLADGTELTLSGAALLRLGLRSGKELELARGGLSADVSPQPVGQPMLVGTPQARLTVLGTRFLLESQPASTRLEVTEGLVHMERLSDGSATEVPARHSAVASADHRQKLSSRPTTAPVTAWRPTLRDQLSRGIWNPGNANRPPRVTSVPFEPPGQAAPVLLQVCSLQPPADSTGPVLLSPGAKFLVRGSSHPGREVFVGVTARHSGGGLAGPYSARFIPTPSIAGPAGSFTAEVPVSALQPRMQGLQSSPEAMEMVDWWAGSRLPDNTVEIESVELLPGPAATPAEPRK